MSSSIETGAHQEFIGSAGERCRKRGEAKVSERLQKFGANVTRKKPPAPANLGAPGRRFWHRIVENFDLEKHHLDVCEQACRALDRAESAREQIDREGMTVLDRFGQPKPHPLLAAERDARSAFRQLYRELGVNDDDAGHEIGRPPRGYCV